MDSQAREHPEDIPSIIALLESYARDVAGLGLDDLGQRLEKIAGDLRHSTRKIRFVDEVRATEISNRSRQWLRARFDEWAVAGGAMLRDGNRYYRECVLPRRIPDPRIAQAYPRRTP